MDEFVLVLLGAAAAGGYVAAIYTWPKIRAFVGGAQAEAARLRAKAAALEAGLKRVI